MQVSGLLKNFIDHMSYNFHRPRFYNKKALIITTTVKEYTTLENELRSYNLDLKVLDEIQGFINVLTCWEKEYYVTIYIKW